MDLDIHPEKWLEFFHENPVLEAALIGLVCGLLLTQIIKKTWLAFGNTLAVTKDRFTVAAMWLGVVTTYLCTHAVWFTVVGKSAHGLERIVCGVTAVLSLGAYWLLVWVLEKWQPAAAAWLGTDKVMFKDTPP